MRYRSISVFCLGGWSPLLPTGFLVSRGTLVPSPRFSFRLPGFHCLRHCFPTVSAKVLRGSDGPQPRQSFLHRFGLLPCSLAATWGISFDFFSSGYLDVSVRPVPFSCSWAWMAVHHHSRISPFGCLRVADYLHLSAAFRSLSRPSSADIAKASTVCS